MSAKKVTQEKNVIVVHLATGATQNVCAVTAAWLAVSTMTHAQNLVFAK